VYVGGADKAMDTGYGIRDTGYGMAEVRLRVCLCFMAHAFSPNGKYVFRTPYTRGGELGTAPRMDLVGEIRRRNGWFSASAMRTNRGG